MRESDGEVRDEAKQSTKKLWIKYYTIVKEYCELY